MPTTPIEATPSDSRIKEIVILGGGTAGWMAASYLSTHLQGSVRVTLIEAPAIGKIGVGEATVPNLQKVFFDFLGLAERDWMPHCNGSFKVGVRFINWRTSGAGVPAPRSIGGGPDHFYHPFGILPDCDQIPISHYWFLKKHQGKTTEAFDYACFREPPLLDANLAPCWLDGRPSTRYAWHFDAHLVAAFLQKYRDDEVGRRARAGRAGEA